MRTFGERWHRVRGSFGLALQTGVAAGTAWFLAHEVLGHTQPFFAPIAAVVTLAISVGQRMRRAVEIVAGNAVGILLGEALILVIGRGAAQVMLVVLLAVLLAIFAGGSAALVSQAASSAALVASLVPNVQDYFFSRFVDALVGGSVGLAVMALLLPLNPLTVTGRAAGPVLDHMTSGLAGVARALREHDWQRAQHALEQLRDAEEHLHAFRDAITAGQEIVTVAPLRWGKRGALAQYVDSYDHVARALRNARVLARRSGTLLHNAEPAPQQLSAAADGLADAVRWLHKELADAVQPEASNAATLRAVRLAGEAYQIGVGFSGSVVVAQVRSMGVDLLRAGGLAGDDARRLIRRALGKAAVKQLPAAQ